MFKIDFTVARRLRFALLAELHMPHAVHLNNIKTVGRARSIQGSQHLPLNSEKPKRQRVRFWCRIPHVDTGRFDG